MKCFAGAVATPQSVNVRQLYVVDVDLPDLTVERGADSLSRPFFLWSRRFYIAPGAPALAKGCGKVTLGVLGVSEARLACRMI